MLRLSNLTLRWARGRSESKSSLRSMRALRSGEEAGGQAATEIGLGYREASGDAGRSLHRRPRQALAHGEPGLEPTHGGKHALRRLVCDARSFPPWRTLIC
jgi:hypothetical protein